MIALSSFRPFTDGNDEYDRNQRYAWEVLHESFTHIIYFNSSEPRLSSSHTLFIPSENFPKIWQLAELASFQEGWCCIINSDIVVMPEGFNAAYQKLKQKKAKAAVSWRWEFRPEIGLYPNKIVDPGQDMFMATPDVWREVAKTVPEGLRLGCQRWDSWMLGAFNAICPKQLYSVTRHRFVLHPKHGNRKYGGEVGDIQPLGQDTWPQEI